MASGSHLLQATENTRHKWRALHLYVQSHHLSIPFLLSWAILQYGIKDNAYSFAWNEDEILREIIAVRMKGIDFYRCLCSSIHPNYHLSSRFLCALQGWNYWPFDFFFLLLWLQNYPLRANNEALTLFSSMSRTFREIHAAMLETDFRNAKKQIAAFTSIFCDLFHIDYLSESQIPSSSIMTISGYQMAFRYA